MGAVAQRRIAEQGTPESAWAPLLQGVPGFELDQFIAADARLVVVSPHPDDELLACGGLLHDHAARGGRCTLLAVTDGEASHVGDARWTPEALGRQRCLERAAGLQALGLPVLPLTRLGFPDGRVQQHGQALCARLQQYVGADDIVVTTWQWDGHSDHEAVGRAALMACEVAGAACLQAPVWLWHWGSPADAATPWARLRGYRMSPSACERKQAALAAHVTQCTPRGEGGAPVLDGLMLARAARAAEYFFVPKSGSQRVG